MGSGMPLKDDTALAADLGLSGSMGGVPSPGRPGSSGLTGTAAGRSGISIFGGEEGGEVADPLAQTNIASNVPEIRAHCIQTTYIPFKRSNYMV